MIDRSCQVCKYKCEFSIQKLLLQSKFNKNKIFIVDINIIRMFLFQYIESGQNLQNFLLGQTNISSGVNSYIISRAQLTVQQHIENCHGFSFLLLATTLMVHLNFCMKDVNAHQKNCVNYPRFIHRCILRDGIILSISKHNITLQSIYFTHLPSLYRLHLKR